MPLRLVFSFLILLAVSACTKESNIKKQLEPAAQATRELQWLSCFAQIPMAESFRDFMSSRQGMGFLQILPDGQILFDYDSGILCADGIVRKGKCKIKNLYSGNGLNDTCRLKAEDSDSFAIQTQSGWVQFSGEITVIAEAYYEFKISGNGQFRASGVSHKSWGELYLELDPQGKMGRSAFFMHRLRGTIKSQDANVAFSKCIKNIGCSAFYSVGSGNVSFTENSLTAKILFDAYGNGQCDQVVKIEEGRNELLFNTW